MHHSFDPSIAKRVGVNAAILFQNITFWIEKNKANGESPKVRQSHFHEGRWWTYNSLTAYSRQFEYLTRKQVYTAIERLKSEGLILVGNFNEKGYDNTNWYALAEDVAELPIEGETLFPQGNDLLPQGNDLFPQGNDPCSLKGTTIPYNKPSYNKPDIEKGFLEFWKLYPKTTRKTQKKACSDKFTATVLGKRKDVEEAPSIEQLLEALARYVSTTPDPQYIPAPLVWLNKCRWEGFMDDPNDPGDGPVSPEVQRYRDIVKSNS